MNPFLGTLGALLGFHLIRRYVIIPRKIRMQLKKYSTSDNVKVVELPEGLYDERVDDNLLDNEIYKSTYYSFGRILEKEVPEEVLNNYYRNFKSIKNLKLTLSFQLKNLIQRGVIAMGGYNTKTNEITLKNTLFSKLLGLDTHELLHAASTYHDKKNKVIYSGFNQIFYKSDNPKENESYGMGINEGYTQCLNGRMFLEPDKAEKIAYQNEQIIAKGLEKVVGEDKMKELYFKADLNGLVNELEKYVSRDEIYKFINVTDILCYLGAHNRRKMPELEAAKSYVNNFMINLIIKANREKLDLEQLRNILTNYIPYRSSNIDLTITDENIPEVQPLLTKD